MRYYLRKQRYFPDEIFRKEAAAVKQLLDKDIASPKHAGETDGLACLRIGGEPPRAGIRRDGRYPCKSPGDDNIRCGDLRRDAPYRGKVLVRDD